MTDDVILTGSNSKFSPHPEGSFVAQLVDVVDMGHRLEACGYVAVRNEDASDGLWKVRGRRQAIYGKADLSLRDRLIAASELVSRSV